MNPSLVEISFPLFQTHYQLYHTQITKENKLKIEPQHLCLVCYVLDKAVPKYVSIPSCLFVVNCAPIFSREKSRFLTPTAKPQLWPNFDIINNIGLCSVSAGNISCFEKVFPTRTLKCKGEIKRRCKIKAELEIIFYFVLRNFFQRGFFFLRNDVT